MTAQVWCTFRRVGFHNWPSAQDILPNRGYLSSRHRHVFHVLVTVPVLHDDRDVEFHELRDHAESWWPDDGEMGSMSCEVIARHIAEHVNARWSLPWVNVQVSEDGEAGADVRIQQ